MELFLFLIWTSIEPLQGLRESLNHSFRTTGHSLSVTWRGRKVKTNEDLIGSAGQLEECVCVCLSVCAGLLLQERETKRGEKGGFIVYDIIKRARKQKSAFSLLSLDEAATPAPHSSSFFLLLWHLCPRPRRKRTRRRRMRCRRR